MATSSPQLASLGPALVLALMAALLMMGEAAPTELGEFQPPRSLSSTSYRVPRTFKEVMSRSLAGGASSSPQSNSLKVTLGKPKKGDSPIYFIRLPSTDMYYSGMGPYRRAIGEKIGVNFTSNGQPKNVYHWNLPYRKKLAEYRAQQSRPFHPFNFKHGNSYTSFLQKKNRKVPELETSLTLPRLTGPVGNTEVIQTPGKIALPEMETAITLIKNDAAVAEADFQTKIARVENEKPEKDHHEQIPKVMRKIPSPESLSNVLAEETKALNRLLQVSQVVNPAEGVVQHTENSGAEGVVQHTEHSGAEGVVQHTEHSGAEGVVQHTEHVNKLGSMHKPHLSALSSKKLASDSTFLPKLQEKLVQGLHSSSPAFDERGLSNGPLPGNGFKTLHFISDVLRSIKKDYEYDKMSTKMSTRFTKNAGQDVGYEFDSDVITAPPVQVEIRHGRTNSPIFYVFSKTKSNSVSKGNTFNKGLKFGAVPTLFGEFRGNDVLDGWGKEKLESGQTFSSQTKISGNISHVFHQRPQINKPSNFASNKTFSPVLTSSVGLILSVGNTTSNVEKISNTKLNRTFHLDNVHNIFTAPNPYFQRSRIGQELPTRVYLNSDEIVSNNVFNVPPQLSNSKDSWSPETDSNLNLSPHFPQLPKDSWSSLSWHPAVSLRPASVLDFRIPESTSTLLSSLTASEGHSPLVGYPSKLLDFNSYTPFQRDFLTQKEQLTSVPSKSEMNETKNKFAGQDSDNVDDNDVEDSLLGQTKHQFTLKSTPLLKYTSLSNPDRLHHNATTSIRLFTTIIPDSTYHTTLQLNPLAKGLTTLTPGKKKVVASSHTFGSGGTIRFPSNNNAIHTVYPIESDRTFFPAHNTDSGYYSRLWFNKINPNKNISKDLRSLPEGLRADGVFFNGRPSVLKIWSRVSKNWRRLEEDGSMRTPRKRVLRPGDVAL